MREDALRRIVEATLGSRFTIERRRELADHLEDSIRGKVDGGMGEADALAQSLEELGDLDRIAASYPAAGPALVTPEGWTNTGSIWTCFAYVVMFTAFHSIVTVRFSELIRGLSVERPSLFGAVATTAEWLAASWPMTFGALIAIGLACWRLNRVPAARRAAPPVSLGLFILLLASMFIAILPFIGVMDAITASAARAR